MWFYELRHLWARARHRKQCSAVLTLCVSAWWKHLVERQLINGIATAWNGNSEVKGAPVDWKLLNTFCDIFSPGVAWYLIYSCACQGLLLFFLSDFSFPLFDDQPHVVIRQTWGQHDAMYGRQLHWWRIKSQVFTGTKSSVVTSSVL